METSKGLKQDIFWPFSRKMGPHWILTGFDVKNGKYDKSFFDARFRDKGL